MSLVSEVHAMQERIVSRMRELEPLVREYEELRELATAMGLGATAAPPEASPAGSNEPAASQRRRQPRSRPSRARGRQAAGAATGGSAEGELADRILEAVRAEPGKTVGEYAVMLDAVPTALYRPVRRLTTDGALVKRARQLFPA
jgi:hypothetical protein